ncbi:MAG TPA: hypothetical protein VIY47_06750 [Ignavibacteriaceae bacterium]
MIQGTLFNEDAARALVSVLGSSHSAIQSAINLAKVDGHDGEKIVAHAIEQEQLVQNQLKGLVEGLNIEPSSIGENGFSLVSCEPGKEMNIQEPDENKIKLPEQPSLGF